MENRKFEEIEDLTTALESAIKERDAAQAVSDSLRLQLEGTLLDRHQLWDLVKNSIDGERRAYQMHVNISMQKQGAGIPYPDSPHLDGAATPKIQAPGPIMRAQRELPSQVLSRNLSRFVTEETERRRQAG